MKEFLNNSWEFIKVLVVMMSYFLILRFKKEMKIITLRHLKKSLGNSQNKSTNDLLIHDNHHFQISRVFQSLVFKLPPNLWDTSEAPHLQEWGGKKLTFPFLISQTIRPLSPSRNLHFNQGSSSFHSFISEVSSDDSTFFLERIQLFFKKVETTALNTNDARTSLEGSF